MLHVKILLRLLIIFATSCSELDENISAASTAAGEFRNVVKVGKHRETASLTPFFFMKKPVWTDRTKFARNYFWPIRQIPLPIRPFYDHHLCDRARQGLYELPFLL